MGEPGLPAHHRLTGEQSAQINGRPRTSGPVAVWERSAAGRAHGHNWRAAGGRVEAPSMVHDAGHGIQCRGRAGGGGLGRGRQANRGETRAKGLRGRADGPPPLQINLVGNGSSCRWASPADAWRRIVSGHRGRRSRSIARRRVAAEAWESRRARDVQRITTFDVPWPSDSQNRLPHMRVSYTYVLACMYETFC